MPIQSLPASAEVPAKDNRRQAEIKPERVEPWDEICRDEEGGKRVDVVSCSVTGTDG
jgi:hypothetical protein